jgi:hypothetical protein
MNPLRWINEGEFRTSILRRCCRSIQELQRAINFKRELDFGQVFSHWKDFTGRNASSKSKFELVQCVLYKLMEK